MHLPTLSDVTAEDPVGANCAWTRKSTRRFRDSTDQMGSRRNATTARAEVHGAPDPSTSCQYFCRHKAKTAESTCDQVSEAVSSTAVDFLHCRRRPRCHSVPKTWRILSQVTNTVKRILQTPHWLYFSTNHKGLELIAKHMLAICCSIHNNGRTVKPFMPYLGSPARRETTWGIHAGHGEPWRFKPRAT